jgi:FHA domain
MIEHGEAMPREAPRRPPYGRPPYGGLPPRRRKRGLIVAGLAGGWVVLLYLTGSLVGGTALLVLFAALGAAAVLSLRSMGFGADHPWVRQLAARPWRDGQDVLRLSMRHLPDVFVTTPSGALLAPNAVDVHLNPADYASLSDVIDIALASASATEVYVDQVAAHGARFTGAGPAEVRITGDQSVPVGRYLLRQGKAAGAAAPGGQPVDAAGGYRSPVAAAQVPAWRPPAMAGRPGDGHQPAQPGLAEGSFVHAHDGCTSTGDVLRPQVDWLPTVAELRPPPVPLLSLVTGEAVVQTTASGALAGRGAVDLPLPQVPTISREHARFTYSGGQWWVTNLGRNGLVLNGQPVVGEHPVRHGDLLRWGRQGGAPVSRVEIGAG